MTRFVGQSRFCDVIRAVGPRLFADEAVVEAAVAVVAVVAEAVVVVAVFREDAAARCGPA